MLGTRTVMSVMAARHPTVLRGLGRPRRFSDYNKSAMDDFRSREKGNYVIAGALLAFVGGIYYTAINKMKQQDDLADVLEDDAKSP